MSIAAVGKYGHGKVVWEFPPSKARHKAGLRAGQYNWSYSVTVCAVYHPGVTGSSAMHLISVNFVTVHYVVTVHSVHQWAVCQPLCGSLTLQCTPDNSHEVNSVKEHTHSEANPVLTKLILDTNCPIKPSHTKADIYSKTFEKVPDCWSVLNCTFLYWQEALHCYIAFCELLAQPKKWVACRFVQNRGSNLLWRNPHFEHKSSCSKDKEDCPVHCVPLW